MSSDTISTDTPARLPLTAEAPDQAATPACPPEPAAGPAPADRLPLPEVSIAAASTDDLSLSFDDFMGIATEPAAASQAASTPRQAKPSPLRLIVDTAVRSALSRTVLAKLRSLQPVVIILQVPSPAWVDPVRYAIETLAGGGIEVVKAAARPKMTSNGRDDREDDAVRVIAMGRPVIGIAPSPDYLPRVLTAAADHTIAVPAPDPALMRQVLARWCGTQKPVFLRPEDLAGLDLRDLAVALRPHTTPRACVKRLRRASRLRVGPPEADKAPPLQALSGYGKAKDWGMGLVADIARVKAGRLDPAELEGAIFLGAPGTGKTLLARSIASEARVPFLSTSVARWFGSTEGYLNNIIQEIDRFCDALLQAIRSGNARTAIGFLDEVDALPSRARLGPRNADFWTAVITHCLMRWEELRRAGIILIGATNHADHVDPALLRPGRFDRQFEILPPDEAGRLGILKMHLGSDLADADLTLAARLSHGATGAVLAGHVKGARRRARGAERPLSLDDLLAEIAPADFRTAEEIRTIALHEAAHAVSAHRLGLAVVQVSTLPSGDAAGATTLRLSGGIPDRPHLERRALALLAGRAADVVLGAGPNAGAVQDLLEATRVVTGLHASFGLGTSLAHRVAPVEAERLLQWDVRLSELVEADLQRLMRQAEALVRADRNAILAVAEVLRVRRVLTGDEVAGIMAAYPPRLRIRAGRAVRASLGNEAGPGLDRPA
ncbi:AAA family ATPase [Microvirga aerilata]|uniref:AAA family ATPase n=1 Tax=Microvirga aerilata TaxID=670292 RepID=A0A936ZFE2_9HYPH|nr:AAA family ATPase [Microvirga aerilata]MBL0403734.1 AAA family ATPase [Microvirga aerilata]